MCDRAGEFQSDAAGTTRLWLALDSTGRAAAPGDTLVVDLSGEGDGVRLTKTATAEITQAGMPGLMFLDLGPEYFHGLGGSNRG